MFKFLRRKKQCIEDVVESVQKTVDAETTGKYYSDVADDTSLDNPYRDSKCDYCNCALRDCSLCGTNSDG